MPVKINPGGPGERHALLMCPPTYYSADKVRNLWMEEMTLEERMIDGPKALAQFEQVRQAIAALATVRLMPARPGLAEQVFTAEIGFVPAGPQDVVIMADDGTPRGELAAGRHYLQSLGLRTLTPPGRFGGQGDIRHVRDNLYVGGYGESTEPAVFSWLSEEFDLRIIGIEEVDPYLYGVENIILPIRNDEMLVCTELLNISELRDISDLSNIIDVSVDLCYGGICSSIILSETVFNSDNLSVLETGSDEYLLELAKNETLARICRDRGLDLQLLETGEFSKSGALLTSLTMDLGDLGAGLE